MLNYIEKKSSANITSISAVITHKDQFKNCLNPLAVLSVKMKIVIIDD